MIKNEAITPVITIDIIFQNQSINMYFNNKRIRMLDLFSRNSGTISDVIIFVPFLFQTVEELYALADKIIGTKRL